MLEAERATERLSHRDRKCLIFHTEGNRRTRGKPSWPSRKPTHNSAPILALAGNRTKATMLRGVRFMHYIPHPHPGIFLVFGFLNVIDTIRLSSRLSSL